MGIAQNVANKVYYVSTSGADNTDTGRGSSPELRQNIKLCYSQLHFQTQQILKQSKFQQEHILNNCNYGRKKNWYYR